MEARDIQRTVARGRAFFATGNTHNLRYRIAALNRLEWYIGAHEEEIAAALTADLGKAPFEGYMTEIGLVLEELRYVRSRLRLWAAGRCVPTPLSHFPSRSFTSPQPYGVVLIMSPWNYPFMLTLSPLIGAIAAGNCAVVKPSAYSPATSGMVTGICAACFVPGHVTVVEGGRAENTQLLEQRFDYVFFTGSTEVGKLVMQKAAANLTPVSLELGGKSPCIVDATANIPLAGRRIAFGKWLNAGQTCIAPDYVLVQAEVHDELVAAIQKATYQFFGVAPLQNKELPRIVNEKHFARLKGLMGSGAIAFGGGSNEGTLRMEPTLLTGVNAESPVMQEEIFGPILPVLPVADVNEAIRFVNAREKPLALYLFTRSRKTRQAVLDSCCFGGGCINDTVVHIASSHMPFGGVGHSGMGSYHGKKSFETFSHTRSILEKSNLVDLPVRYHPYTKAKEALLRKIM